MGVSGFLQKQESKSNTWQPVCGNEGSSVSAQMLSLSVAFSLPSPPLLMFRCFTSFLAGIFLNHTIKKRTLVIEKDARSPGQEEAGKAKKKKKSDVLTAREVCEGQKLGGKNG